MTFAPNVYIPHESRSCIKPRCKIGIRDPDQPTNQPSCLEYSVHTANITFKRELKAVMPSINVNDNILIIPTFQPVRTSLTEVTELSELEKNRLLELFAGWAKSICQRLIGRGFMADFIDPCTGYPSINSHTSCVYNEVDAATMLLRYRVEQAGFCSIVLHPDWGSASYPASMLTNANLDSLTEAIEAANRRWKIDDARFDNIVDQSLVKANQYNNQSNDQSNNQSGSMQTSAASTASDLISSLLMI